MSLGAPRHAAYVRPCSGTRAKRVCPPADDPAWAGHRKLPLPQVVNCGVAAPEVLASA